MSALHRCWDIPDSTGQLSIHNVLFTKKGKETFFRLPATNNLPKLPHEKAYIMDRDEDLQEIHDNFLEESATTKQVLIAKGGLGKSTLARLYARKYFKQKGYYAYVWWFNAEDEATLAASIAEVNKEMGITANDYRNMRQGMDKIEEKLQAS